MKIAYIVFDGITWLDMVGVYEPVSKLKSNNFLPDLTWDICGYTASCEDIFGLRVMPMLVQNDLSAYDAVIVPGGPGTRTLLTDESFITWLQTASAVRYKISICTGSLLLGAAGFLEGKRATTNFQEYDTLVPYCKEVMKDRIVEDGDVITAGAVTSSIDLGLYLCSKWSGDEAMKTIRRKIDYHG